MRRTLFVSASDMSLYNHSRIHGQGKGFIKYLVTGYFSIGELSEFINEKPLLVDQFFDDQDLTLDKALEESEQDQEIDEVDKNL